MDDRMRRENSHNGENINSNSPREPRNEQWDFNNNVSSNSQGEKINPTAHLIKRFEVHIPESEDFPAIKAETPTRVPAPAKRPSPMPSQTTGRPSATPGQPVRRPTGVPGQPVRYNTPVRPQRQSAPSGVSATKAPVNAGEVKRAKPTGTAASSAKAKSNSSARAGSTQKTNKKTKGRKASKNRGDMAYNLAKGILITCVCLIFIATLTTVVSSVAFGFINDILVIDDENKGYSVVIEIPEGATYETIFEILKENGLVSQPLLTDFFLKFRHYDYQAAYDDETGELLYDENTGKVLMEPIEYQPGVYYVYADSGIENILDSMLANNNYNKDTVRLMFPEGCTIAEVFEKIEKYEVCEAEKLYANLEIVASQYDFIEKITDSEGRYLKAEGYLFPDTYDFFIGESASSVIKKLLTNFEVKWEKEYDARLKELGMSMDQIITLASIIQCEAKDGTQMADISSVIHNRLNNAASYPTLDMDSTSDYINSLKSFNILSDVEYTLYLDSYNTYSKTGLPPGPICNPSASAIRAALYPAENDYYFFCHSDSGEVYFASTASEHQENVQRVVYGSVGGE